MLKRFRVLSICLGVCLLAARVDAQTITIAWDPNTESDLARYVVGYRTSPTGSETTANAGLTTTWTLTSATPGATYYFRVYAENTAGLRSAPSNEVSTTVPTTPPPPTGGGLALERGRLNFGAVRNAGSSSLGIKTPSQRVMVTQTTGSSPVSWTASSVGTGSSRISVTPSSGTGTGPITISLASTSLSAGTYNNTVRVRTGTTDLNIAITTRVFNNGASAASTGTVDTPQDGVTNVTGAIPVTGWAADDVGVARVDIYRDAVGSEPAGALIFLGQAAFVSGSRPDVEDLYPNNPLNYRGGWGFMVLTNMLPDLFNGRATGGNGPFRVHAYAVDLEGRATYLGGKRFSANNSAAVRPFGTIDTPAQGGVASGSAYMVFGWAVSPGGRIPTNGSTITVFVDGNAVGHPVYNNYRQDIADMFPGYQNSSGAIGYFPLDTTQLANGTHTISWVVTDNQGQTEGIGSRFFTVQNGSSPMTAAAVEGSTLAQGSHGSSIGQSADTMAQLPPDYSIVEVKKPASTDSQPELVFPEWSGAVQVSAKETDPIEVRLSNGFDGSEATYEGYVVAGRAMRPLPVGSTLDPSAGTFRWQPGPGFAGTYEFLFVRNSGGYKTRIPVTITFTSKFDER